MKKYSFRNGIYTIGSFFLIWGTTNKYVMNKVTRIN